MRANRLSQIVAAWGTKPYPFVAGYVWLAAMFALLAALETNRVGLYLVPPFGATLSILLLLPESPIAQPYALIVGSVAGAAVGTAVSFFAHGLPMAALAAVIAFGVISLLHAYHPPGVALAIYPLLLHPGNWFPLTVVLPFTLVAVVTAALLSQRVKRWPAYPRPLSQGQ